MASKLIPELGKVINQFSDCSIVFPDTEEIFQSNSLLLAGVSPMLREALKNTSDEDDIVIIVPGESFTKDLEVFFSMLLCWTPENVNSVHSEAISRVLKLFAVKTLSSSDIADRQNLNAEPQDRIKTRKKLFQCENCNASFSSLKLKKRHARTLHSENHPHVCKECGRRCRGQAELAIHRRSHTKEKPFSCDCGKSFAQKSQLNDHVLKVHFSTQLSSKICDICGLTLSTLSAVKKHSLVHAGQKQESDPSVNTGDSHLDEKLELKVAGLNDTRDCVESSKKEISCQKCGKCFTQQSHLNVHVKIMHEGSKPFMCSYCGRQFSVKSNLKKHIGMHEKKRSDEIEEFRVTTLPFKIDMNPVVAVEASSSESNFLDPRFICEVCGRICRSHSDLIAHNRRSHNKKPLTCSVCQMSFDTWSARKIHLRLHSGKEQFVCTRCNLSCVSRSALEKHNLIHTGERPFACDVDNCGKTFVQKSQLNYHVKVVHGPPVGSRPRNHTCTECNAKFTTSSTLRKHERTHTNDRPHICDICGKGFIQRVHLETHLLGHSNTRPFICTECDKSFVTASKLHEHLKTHSKERALHECSEPGCDASYVNASDLTVHVRKHTGELPFVCGTCSRGFRSKRLLDDHARSIHSEFSSSLVCRNCSKVFSSNSGLKNHLRKHYTCRLAATVNLSDHKSDLIIEEPILLIEDNETVIGKMN